MMQLVCWVLGKLLIDNELLLTVVEEYAKTNFSTETPYKPFQLILELWEIIRASSTPHNLDNLL